MEKLPELAAALDDLVGTYRRLIEAGETPPPTVAVATPGQTFLYRRQADGALSWEGEVTLPEGATVEASILRAFWQGVLDACL